MRAYIIAAAAAFALAGCNKAEEPAAPAETPAAETAPAAGGMAMDHDMSAADAADDANTAETPEGFMFHTYPAKTETVHLPAAGAGTWTATASDGSLVAIGEGKDETMPDGATHYVVKVDPKASGNTDVTFERRDSADPAAPVTETRTVHFMIH
jgi:hypothetical protein